MKIKSIETIMLSYEEPNDHANRRNTLLIKLTTESGVVGWGEAIAMWPEACLAVKTLIDKGLMQVVIGLSISQPLVIWQALRKHSWWYGEGGIASMAISGIDIAVWDAKGKIESKPLYELFGGCAHQKLPAIASMHVNKATDEENVTEINSYIEGGFLGAKLGFGKKGPAKVGENARYDVDFVDKVRQKIGKNSLLMIDIGNGVKWDVITAIWAANAMDEIGIEWIEEPLYSTDLEGLCEMRKKTKLRIATGEREFTQIGYKRLIDSNAVDVIGYDPARAEGLTGFIKTANLCEVSNKIINAHAWSTAITSAASLHASFSTTSCWIFELKPIPSPMQHELVETPIWHKDGYMYPLEKPGLGITIKEEIIEKYRVK